MGTAFTELPVKLLISCEDGFSDGVATSLLQEIKGKQAIAVKNKIFFIVFKFNYLENRSTAKQVRIQVAQQRRHNAMQETTKKM
jgi:hypothetical protein